MAKKTPIAPVLPAPDHLPEVLTSAQAAAFLTVSRNQLAVWRVRGVGPVWSRIGERRVAYRLADLRAFVAAGLQKGA